MPSFNRNIIHDPIKFNCQGSAMLAVIVFSFLLAAVLIPMTSQVLRQSFLLSSLNGSAIAKNQADSALIEEIIAVENTGASSHPLANLGLSAHHVTKESDLAKKSAAALLSLRTAELPRPDWANIAADPIRDSSCQSSLSATSQTDLALTTCTALTPNKRHYVVLHNLVVSDLKLLSGTSLSVVGDLIVKGEFVIAPGNEILVAGNIQINSLVAPYQTGRALLHSSIGKIDVSLLEIPYYSCKSSDGFGIRLEGRNGVKLGNSPLVQTAGCAYARSWPKFRILGWQ